MRFVTPFITLAALAFIAGAWWLAIFGH